MISWSRIGGDGTYAERRYREGLRSWRRAARLPAALILGVPAILAFGWGIYVHQMTGLLAGCVAGAFAAGWGLIRDEPPAYLQSWRSGAEGERKTAKVLKPMQKNGWVVVHDIDTGRGNYDHVVVGPAGVFLLETKNLTGIVEIRDGEPWLHRRHDPEGDRHQKGIPNQALSYSVGLNKAITSRCGDKPWVQAVVVLWSDFPQQELNAGNVMYLHGSRLKDWLISQPPKLGTGAQAMIAGALAALKVEGDIRAKYNRKNRDVP